MAEYIKNADGEKFPASMKSPKSDTMDSFESCSLMIEKDELVIDIDVPSDGAHSGSDNIGLTTEKILKIINHFGIKTEYWITANGGVHLVFARPDDIKQTWSYEGVCALGIKVEYKSPMSKTRTPRTHCVKIDGVPYEVHNQGMRQALPDIFRMAGAKRDGLRGFPEVLCGMREGSRDTALFQHSLQMPIDRYDAKRKRKIFTFINEYLFAEPLEASQLESKIELKGQDKGIPEETTIAKQMVEELKPTHHLQQLYFKHPRFGFVKHADATQFDYMVEINKYHPDRLTMNQMKEIGKQMELRSKRTDPNGEFYMNLANGFLTKGQFIEINDPDFSPYNIRHAYDPDAEVVEIVENYLNFISHDDPDTRKTILQMIASGLITEFDVKGSLKKFFKLKGVADSGKGTLVKVITAIFGREQTTFVKPNEMDNDKSKASMVGKLMIIGDDVKKGALNDECTTTLKNAVSCDTINAKLVYKDGMDVRLIGTVIYTTNHVIKMIDKDLDLQAKEITIPLDRAPEKKDKDLVKKLTTDKAMAYWMKLVVEAYFDLYNQGEYFISERVKQATRREAEENMNVLTFLNDFADRFTAETLAGYPISYIYEFYKAWCISENGEETPKDLSQKTFEDVIKKELGIGSARLQLHRSWGTVKFFVHKDDDGVEKKSDLKHEYPRIVKGAEPIELSQVLPHYATMGGSIVREPNKEEQANSVKHMSMYDHAMDARNI